MKYVFYCKERFAAKNVDMSLLYKKKVEDIDDDAVSTAMDDNSTLHDDSIK